MEASFCVAALEEALGNRAPMAVWRAGVTGDRAVLVLRTSLDNAGALPTSPQPPQQQALIA